MDVTECLCIKGVTMQFGLIMHQPISVHYRWASSANALVVYCVVYVNYRAYWQLVSASGH